jgi:hypothetical protein
MLTELDDIRRTIERALPPDVVAALRDDGISLALTPSSDLGPVVTISDELAARELLGDMVNYKKDITGVDNTVFISQKGYARHGPRIKVAIDPPDSINVTSKTVSFSISSGEVVAGDEADVSAALQKEVEKFIALNRDVLLDYWNAQITTNQLEERLKAVSEE